ALSTHAMNCSRGAILATCTRASMTETRHGGSSGFERRSWVQCRTTPRIGCFGGVKAARGVETRRTEPCELTGTCTWIRLSTPSHTPRVARAVDPLNLPRFAMAMMLVWLASVVATQ